MNKIYKIEFETVTPIRGHQYYAGDKPVCKPEFVPDEFWGKSSVMSDSPWDQYNTLKKWAKTGEQLVRNVQLFEADSITWKPLVA